jgi:hypothetical protein
MPRPFLFTLAAALLTGCAAEQSAKEPALGYYGGNGSSRQQAVVVVMRGDDKNPGISREAWLQQKYPGSSVEAMFNPPNDPSLEFTIYRVRTHAGKVIEVWFKVICIHCPVIV